MNRLIRLSLLLLLATMASLQLQAKKHPFVMEGKKWVYKKDNNYITYEIQGYTIIGGEDFKKMFCSQNGSDFIYHGAVQDVDRCVYIIYAGEEEKKIVYDCSDSMESRVTLACGLTYDAFMQRPVEIDGEPYRYIHYCVPPFADGSVMIGWEICIEGFGGISIDLLSKDYIEAQVYHLSKCFEGDEDMSWVVYQCEELPVYSETTVISPQKISSIESTPFMFDLQGRKMNDGNSLPKGIYIMGGRKVVVR